jgi:hypothetical protein
MEVHKRMLGTKILLFFLLGILSFKVLSVYVVSKQIFSGKIILVVSLKWLFLPLVCVVLFSMLWNALKAAYILLVLGLALVYVVLYVSFPLPVQVLEILQTIGMILFAISAIWIVVFLIGKRSGRFLEDSIKKWAGR